MSTKPSTEDKTNDDSDDTDSGQTACKTDVAKATPHEGKLIIDATVAEQAIRFPTDLSLLNEAREISEKIIDELYPHTALQKKPRTYREKARKDYLAIVEQGDVETVFDHPQQVYTRELARASLYR